jgi:hypothetical protein
VRAASTAASQDLSSWPSPSHPQHHDQPSNQVEYGDRTTYRDFVEMRSYALGAHSQEIHLEGNPEAVQDLLHFVGDHLNRQFTGSEGQLCALYALEISLRSMYPEQSPTFQVLHTIWQSEEFYYEAQRQADIISDDSFREELYARENLSFHAILIILQILGNQMGQRFALGICSLAQPHGNNMTGSTPQTYSVHIHGDNFSTATVWIYNDRAENTSNGLSHWSGFGVDPPAQRGYLGRNPNIVLITEPDNVYSEVVQSGAHHNSDLPFLTDGSFRSTTWSSHSTAETPLSDNSRLGSVEPSNSNFNGGLSPSLICMSRTNSSNSGLRNPRLPSPTDAHARSPSRRSSTSKDYVQCKECGKLIQANGLR